MRQLTIDDLNNWVEALRSGNYRQGSGYLKSKMDDDKFAYCCLGVAVETTDPQEWETRDDYNEPLDYFRIDGESEILPATIIDGMVQAELASMNDGCSVKIFGNSTSADRKYSFREIADWIEQNLTVRDGLVVMK